MGWLNGLINENAYKSLYAKLDQHKDLSICTGGYGFSLAKDGPNDPYSKLDEARGFYFQAHQTVYEKIAGVFYGLSTFLFFGLIVLGLFLRFFKSTKKA
ncbi:MAG: hypothetical protein NWS40_04685 [Crocinitomicaceae bacterium]|jgi:hypothetical protein|nr:hypothetical protein [Crocinitomicaceae bacterium]MDP4865041.1 hypothetical protein [Crocinitomicaceae bacterium]MDP5011032.1 hypothetical protein [Crocinitomicaceae bacterium]MDP5099373.1 hypothetical protein [Crocinitomicaceae bacterium]